MIRSTVILGSVGTMFAVACTSGSTTESQTTTPLAAMIYGRVLDHDGVPLANARVSSTLFRGACGSGQAIGEGSPTLVATDANGTYRHQVISLIDGADLCVRVTAAPTNNPSVTATAQGQRVRLKRLAPASLPYDSVRVDVRLP